MLSGWENEDITEEVTFEFVLEESIGAHHLS